MELNKIHNMDCMEYMKTLPNQSVNLIIADAPYFSTNIKEVGDKQWKKEEDYVNWVIENFKEYERISKDNGSVYFFHNDINIMVEILYRIKRETKFKLKNQITWDKLATGNQDFLMPLYKNSKLKRRYATSLTEYIYYFTFEDNTGLSKVMLDINNFKTLREYSKDLQEYIGLNLKQINMKLGNRRAEHFFYHSSTQWGLCTEEVYNMLINTFEIDKFSKYKTYKELRDEYDALRSVYQKEVENYESLRYQFNQPYLITPRDINESRNVIRRYSTVWHYERDNKIYEKHLTPKPIDMIKHILDISSKENDLVYIPFAGSGSDIIACVENNRNYIATNINKKKKKKIIYPRLENIQ